MRDGSSKMSTATNIQVDTSALSSMEFEPICECSSINALTREFLDKCENPAEWVATFHGIVPVCGTVTKLVCTPCLTNIKTLNCTACEAERFISAMSIKETA